MAMSYYKTINWTKIEHDVKVDIKTYIQDNFCDGYIDEELNDVAITSHIWNEAYGVTVEKQGMIYYLRFKDEDGYTRFVMQWM